MYLSRPRIRRGPAPTLGSIIGVGLYFVDSAFGTDKSSSSKLNNPPRTAGRIVPRITVAPAVPSTKQNCSQPLPQIPTTIVAISW